MGAIDEVGEAMDAALEGLLSDLESSAIVPVDACRHVSVRKRRTFDLTKCSDRVRRMVLPEPVCACALGLSAPGGCGGRPVARAERRH